MIRIEVRWPELSARLDKLALRGAALRPILQDIGEVLLDSTRQRFAKGIDPSGQPWRPNAPQTIKQWVRRRLGATVRRKGETARRPTEAELARAAAEKRPLIGESLALSTTISYELEPTAVLVGSPMSYAAVHQFGSAKKNIPARPFLGLSAEDQRAVIEIVEEALRDALQR